MVIFPSMLAAKSSQETSVFTPCPVHDFSRTKYADAQESDPQTGSDAQNTKSNPQIQITDQHRQNSLSLSTPRKKGKQSQLSSVELSRAGGSPRACEEGSA